MRKIKYYKFILLFAICLLSTNLIGKSDYFNYKFSKFTLIYNNVWGAIYHAIEKECDDTPTITGDGSKINLKKASELRWIAISQDMLNDKYRKNLLNDENSPLFKGKIKYGDTIWIISPYQSINGWWVVHDTKNSRYTKSIDFLQTIGDSNLYENNSQWDGKFNKIKIYRKNGFKLY